MAKAQGCGVLSCLNSIRTLSIASLITILLLSFASITIIWVVTYAVNTTKFTDRLMTSLFELTVAKVEDSLQIPFISMQTAADVVRSNSINLQNTTCEELSPLVWKYFLSMEKDLDKLGFSCVYFGLLDGALCGYMNIGGTIFHANSWPYEGVMHVTPVNHPALENDGMHLVNDSFDLDYSQPVSTYFLSESEWTKSYEYNSFIQAVWITAVLPFKTAEGVHYGFLAYDADLIALSKTLYSIKIEGSGSSTFMIEWGTMNLLATSFQDKNPFTIATVDGYPVAQRMKGEDFSEIAVSDTTKQMYKLFGSSFESLELNQQHTFQYTSSEGVAYMVTAMRMKENGAELVIVLTIPQIFFFGEFIIAICLASVISLVLLLLFVGFVVIGITIFIYPIYNLISQFPKIESMQLDKVKFAKSFFTEIKSLQTGFSHMISKLKEYRAFIPEHLLNNEHEPEPETIVTAHDKTPMLGGNKRRVIPQDGSPASPSTRSVMSTPRSSGLGGAAENMFNLGLYSKDITILCVRTSSFKDMLLSMSASEMVDLHGQIIGGISGIVKRNRGQIVSFNKEEMVIAFNALNKVKDHVDLACKAALAIKELGDKMKADLISNGKHPVIVCMSITTGQMYCGNVGTATMKQFCVEGQGVELACKMASLCTVMGATILVENSISDKLAAGYIFRGIERIVFPDINGSKVIVMHSLERSKGMYSDEWMYELEQQKSMNVFNDYNQGFKLYLQGKFREAQKMFSNALVTLPDDAATIRMLKMCKQFENSEYTKTGLMMRSGFDMNVTHYAPSVMNEQT